MGSDDTISKQLRNLEKLLHFQQQNWDVIATLGINDCNHPMVLWLFYSRQQRQDPHSPHVQTVLARFQGLRW